MIQANELRIGNKVYFPFEGKDVDVVGLVLDPEYRERIQVRVHENNGSVVLIDYENLHPIPLTEEWLLKFGFTLDDTKMYELEIKGCFKFRVAVNSWIEVSRDIDESLIIFEITQVHLLQNLVHALTGEELTIKP